MIDRVEDIMCNELSEDEHDVEIIMSDELIKNIKAAIAFLKEQPDFLRIHLGRSCDYRILEWDDEQKKPLQIIPETRLGGPMISVSRYDTVEFLWYLKHSGDDAFSTGINTVQLQ